MWSLLFTTTPGTKFKLSDLHEHPRISAAFYYFLKDNNCHSKLMKNLISDFPLRKLTQEALWITNFGFQLPFAGLDLEGCKYLDHNCTAETVSDKQMFSYPIEIKKMYPAVLHYY